MKRFLEIVGEFSNMEIDACEEEEAEDTAERNWEEKMAGNKVLQLKGNIIPKGLVPLERLFEKNDVPLSQTESWKKPR